MYTSVNGGTSWVALNGSGAGPFLPSTVASGAGKVSALVVDPNHGDPVFGTLYAATSGFGVYKSINGGAGWTAGTGILPADVFITALALDPFPVGAFARLYAGTSTGKLYRSDNNGSNWTPLGTGLPGKPITAFAIRVADPTVIYAALSGAGVYYSQNSGVNWQVLDNTGLSLDVAGLAVDATLSPQTLYAATLGRGMHDFEIVPVTAPAILLQSPPGPYPFEASSSSVDVVATGGSTPRCSGPPTEAMPGSHAWPGRDVDRLLGAPRDRVEPHHPDGRRRELERGEHLAHGEPGPARSRHLRESHVDTVRLRAGGRHVDPAECDGAE